MKEKFELLPPNAIFFLKGKSKELAIQYVIENVSLLNKCKTINDILKLPLSSGFSFVKTKEGYSFWGKINNDLHNKRLITFIPYNEKNI